MSNPLISLLIGTILLVVVTALFWPERGLISRWRSVRRMTSRVLQEDALKYIQKIEFGGQTSSTQGVAGALGIDLNRAVEVIAELETLGLVERVGERLRLTNEGSQVAMNVIRAHRLWEQYLAENTGYQQSEWHNQAEHFEHNFTAEELDQLAGALGNPLYDPHGDPIPSKEGQFFDHDAILLTDLELGQAARIVHVGDEPETVAAQIEAEGLLPGMIVRVSEKTSNRVKFWANGEEHLLAPIVAVKISVQRLEEFSEDLPVPGIPLNMLSMGQKGRVLQLSPRLRGPERRRLLDLGMLPGTVVEAEMSSPMGDPVAYRVRDSLIALRGEQARCIQVELVPEGEVVS
jgi:DtxR family Mn-dependent transcriptional regulator